MTLAPPANVEALDIKALPLGGPAASDVEEALREIASRASVRRERLSTAYEPLREAPLQTKRLERWREQVGGGGAAFAKRLAWDGMGEDEAGRFVRQARLRPDAPLPAWTAVLRVCIERAGRGVAPEEPFLKADEPLPYEDLVGAFVLAGRELLRARCAESGHV